MLRLEARMPGFAGYFVDENEQLVLLRKGRSSAMDARIRQLVDSTYRSSTSPVVRFFMSMAPQALVLSASHSISELLDAHTRIAGLYGVIPDLTGVGIAVHRNRVVAYVRENASSAESIIRSRGIPDDAFEVIASGEQTLSATWEDVHRPTKGGILIQVWDGRYDSNDTIRTFNMSLGFNVRLASQPGSPTRMLTVAHAPNAYAATNGSIGTPFWQPSPAWPFTIGAVTENPAWQTNCQLPQTPGQTWDFCGEADVSLLTYASGVTSERSVGTSVTQGNDGNPGSSTINGWYAISDTIPVSLVPRNRRNIFKSGYRTGTTSGTLGVTNLASMSPAIGWGDPRIGATKSLILVSQVRVDSMGWGRGDSGAPVFVHTKTVGVCSPYCALGIQNTGGGQTNANGVCIAGKACYIGLSTWGKIEENFGLGRLNPKTN